MRPGLQFKIRIPPELKQWLDEESVKNLRSVTAEIVLSVRERKEREDRKTKAAPEGVPAPTEA